MDIIPQIAVNSIITGSIYALVALGFNLIYGTTRFFNITHGAILAAGGYGTFFFLKTLNLNIFISIVLGVLVAALVGWLSEVLVFRKMRKKKASSMVMLIASLGLFTALQATISIIFSSQFQTLGTSIPQTRTLNIAGGVITDVQLVILICSILIMIGLVFVIEKTKFGKAVQAVSDDEEVAKIVGIRTDKIIGKVFIIGSAIAGVAGIAVGFDTGIAPTMGMSLLLKGVVAAIVGGVGNVYGGFIGAFMIGFIENFSVWKISGEWKDAISFIFLILFLIVRPGGIIKRK